MQSTSELYRELMRDPMHSVETRVDIAGTTYDRRRIIQCETSAQLIESAELLIGCCIARQLDLTIRPVGDIPRQAEIRLYARLASGLQVSEWIPRGVFFISRREEDAVSGLLTLHAYDAMLKSGAVWLDSSYDTLNWPMPAQTAAEDITRRMGVELDPRTALDPAFPVQYPVDNAGDMTMGEVLSRLAVANAGNWTITNAGKLLLVPLNSAPAETSYLVTEHGEAITFGGVRILV